MAHCLKVILQGLCLLYLSAVSFYDIREGRIPNILTLAFFAATLLADIITAPSRIPKNLLCASFFFSVLYFVAGLTNGLGMGDAKMAAALGYGAGFFKTSLSLILACSAGVMFFIAAKAAKRGVKKIPFAPFVTVGYAMSELFCRRIL